MSWIEAIRARLAAATLVEVLRCPFHGVYAVAIDHTRVTPKKCCGSWTPLARWQVPAADVFAATDLARLLTVAAAAQELLDASDRYETVPGSIASEDADAQRWRSLRAALRGET